MTRVGICLIAATSVLAAAVWAGVGDVIRTVAWPGARNAYRDAGYVFCVAGVNTFRTYTACGSLVRTVVFTGAGSVVTTFNVPGTTLGCVCGPGYPSSRGTTYWCNIGVGSSRYAYQIDLGNATAVAPASLGRIKALYR